MSTWSGWVTILWWPFKAGREKKGLLDAGQNQFRLDAEARRTTCWATARANASTSRGKLLVLPQMAPFGEGDGQRVQPPRVFLGGFATRLEPGLASFLQTQVVAFLPSLLVQPLDIFGRGQNQLVSRFLAVGGVR